MTPPTEKRELPNLYLSKQGINGAMDKPRFEGGQYYSKRPYFEDSELYVPAECIREILDMDVGIWDCKCGCGKRQMIERLIGLEKEST